MPHLNPGVNVRDEGGVVGRYLDLDFIGSGVTATAGSGKADITVSGGGGGGSATVSSGLLSARPAAGTFGSGLYYATDVDTLYTSNGASWTTVFIDRTNLTGTDLSIAYAVALG